MEDPVSVAVIAQFKASEGNAEAVMALLQEGRDFSLKADGCEAFAVYQREDDLQRFVFVERWASIEAHHANMETNVVATGHLAKIQPLLSEPPESGAYQAV
jgi:heme oxygenase (mycobilin-producing)